jgi:hypothetical protein
VLKEGSLVYKLGVRLDDAGLPRDTISLHFAQSRYILPSYLRYYRARRIPWAIWWGIDSISKILVPSYFEIGVHAEFFRKRLLQDTHGLGLDHTTDSYGTILVSKHRKSECKILILAIFLSDQIPPSLWSALNNRSIYLIAWKK